MLSCIVDGIYVEATKNTSRSLLYCCPECSARLVLRAGSKNIPHFAHKDHSHCRHGQGETLWHRKGKTCIAEIAKAQGSQIVRFEKKIGDRRTDVFVQIKNKKIAFELQKKDEGDSLYKRTKDLCNYVDLVVWILPWRGTNEQWGTRTTATYAINALYSDKKKPKNAEIRFYDEKKDRILNCIKRPYYLFKEEYEEFGGYEYISRRWCCLEIKKEITNPKKMPMNNQQTNF